MGQQLPMALQVALYAASMAIVVLAVVTVRFLLLCRAQIDRIVDAVETLEAELTPLASETRVAVHRIGDLSGSAQRAVGVAGDLLLPPALLVSQAAGVLRTGVATFLQALWAGRHRQPSYPPVTGMETQS